MVEITAREVEARRTAQVMEFPDFSRELRAIKRSLLKSALSGASEDRLSYCIARAAARHEADFVAFGYAESNMDELARRAAWWFARLERLAVKA